MASSFLLAVGLFFGPRLGLPVPASMSSNTELLLTVCVTTAIWLAVTWLTAPTDRAVLHKFYRDVRPSGPGWAAIRRECENLAPADSLGFAFVGWVSGCATVYTALFGSGHLLLGNTAWALAFGVAFVVSAAVLTRVVRRTWTT